MSLKMNEELNRLIEKEHRRLHVLENLGTQICVKALQQLLNVMATWFPKETWGRGQSFSAASLWNAHSVQPNFELDRNAPAVRRKTCEQAYAVRRSAGACPCRTTS